MAGLLLVGSWYSSPLVKEMRMLVHTGYPKIDVGFKQTLAHCLNVSHNAESNKLCFMLILKNKTVALNLTNMNR